MLTLSPWEAIGCLSVIVAIVLFAVALGVSTGEERATRKIKQQAEENGIDWRWLQQGSDGE